MIFLLRLFYSNVFLPIFSAVLRIAGLFNSKIKEGLRDRRKLFENLVIELQGIDKRKKMIWFHSSSLGEFEQAKPILEQLKIERSVNVLVTFFSPSGYKNSIRYNKADLISYLPFDSPSDVRRFVGYVRPSLVIFMRYDIWPNLVYELSSRKVPMVIADATMRTNSNRFLPVSKKFHKQLFSKFSKILTISDEDNNNFVRFGLPGKLLSPVGDTRFDRVMQKSIEAREKILIREEIIAGKQLIVAGSTWDVDENVILPALIKILMKMEDVILILAPHEPTVVNLEKIEGHFPPEISTIRFSYVNTNYNNERVIIIDSIGILLSLYRYAHIAYVGGAFRAGVHNVLEPAVYGIPVVYGPRHTNSQEAVKLIQNGGAKVIRDKKSAYRVFRTILTDQNISAQMGKINKDYTSGNTGATEKIMAELKKLL
ncbi:MAG: 3-deoxy-D-manno-octulosonic acid transferase [Ignavibacteriales bacterium]|nr:3-deoxy-D-manno-octulosonic acid transferase [Ignavibacteriales bacterium]MCF8305193.1 3-deoxy-D-manno-octulosonic acid transferase [Ignavibacteriales bacterium]MCF8314894.1 3-deoxy-D-manno-octulosonic acid transferase [Ignavibacteriales bacterium]MCF8436157.1 3-deoxy-D-manno-octulosonic acid transferase [Ignavibacteriales bacterium]